MCIVEYIGDLALLSKKKAEKLHSHKVCSYFIISVWFLKQGTESHFRYISTLLIKQGGQTEVSHTLVIYVSNTKPESMPSSLRK